MALAVPSTLVTAAGAATGKNGAIRFRTNVSGVRFGGSLAPIKFGTLDSGRKELGTITVACRGRPDPACVVLASVKGQPKPTRFHLVGAAQALYPTRAKSAPTTSSAGGVWGVGFCLGEYCVEIMGTAPYTTPPSSSSGPGRDTVDGQPAVIKPA